MALPTGGIDLKNDQAIECIFHKDVSGYDEPQFFYIVVPLPLMPRPWSDYPKQPIGMKPTSRIQYTRPAGTGTLQFLVTSSYDIPPASDTNTREVVANNAIAASISNATDPDNDIMGANIGSFPDNQFDPMPKWTLFRFEVTQHGTTVTTGGEVFGFTVGLEEHNAPIAEVTANFEESEATGNSSWQGTYEIDSCCTAWHIKHGIIRRLNRYLYEQSRVRMEVPVVGRALGVGAAGAW